MTTTKTRLRNLEKRRGSEPDKGRDQDIVTDIFLWAGRPRVRHRKLHSNLRPTFFFSAAPQVL